MDLTITIPDPVATEVVDALCASGGWRSIPLDGAKNAFAKQVLIIYLKKVTANRKIATTVVVQTDLSGVV